MYQKAMHLITFPVEIEDSSHDNTLRCKKKRKGKIKKRNRKFLSKEKK